MASTVHGLVKPFSNSNLEEADVMDVITELSTPLALIISKAQLNINQRFEDPTSHDNCLAYHNRRHTNGVIIRATQIAEAMDLSKRELMLVQIAAAYHDTVQIWNESSMNDGVVKRVRHAGDNETASALEATQAMRTSDIVFVPTEIGLVSSAILATIPGWSLEHGTVIQPMLNPCSHPIVRAVALADLSAPGMDPDGFVWDGIQLFAEENLDIMRFLRQASIVKDIHPDMQNAWRDRLVAWLKSQTTFARGRQSLLSSELQGLERNLQVRVADKFCSFDESIRKADHAVLRAESMYFVPLMRQLLPTAFPGED